MPPLLTIPTEMPQNIIDQFNPDDLPMSPACYKGLHGVAERRLGKHGEQIKSHPEPECNANIPPVQDLTTSAVHPKIAVKTTIVPILAPSASGMANIPTMCLFTILTTWRSSANRLAV